jgi:hypothetical protein
MGDRTETTLEAFTPITQHEAQRLGASCHVCARSAEEYDPKASLWYRWVDSLVTVYECEPCRDHPYDDVVKERIFRGASELQALAALVSSANEAWWDRVCLHATQDRKLLRATVEWDARNLDPVARSFALDLTSTYDDSPLCDEAVYAIAGTIRAAAVMLAEVRKEATSVKAELDRSRVAHAAQLKGTRIEFDSPDGTR